MDNSLSLLEKEYCPPIDSALFHALTQDYDLSTVSSLAQLRTVLEALKQAALSEETANFDPSGSNGIQDDADSYNSSERAKSWHGDLGSVSADTEDTDLTALSQNLDEVHLEIGCQGIEQRGSDFGWDDLLQDERANILGEMFPDAKAVDVAYVLKKAGNNYGRAVEELLNQAFLEAEVDERGTTMFKRGIEGFSEPTSRIRGKKKKEKKAHLHRRTGSTPAAFVDMTTNSSPSPSSRWDRAKEDIDFIATRTHIPPSTLTSIYHKNGASLPSTIASICRSSNIENPYLSKVLPTVLEAQAVELNLGFPNLKPSQSSSLIQLTYPSTSSAHELANALACSSHALSHERILPIYRPRSPSPTTTSNSILPSALNFPSHTAASLAAARSTAYSQASSAYRISKSKPLMGGAAAYYSSVARDASTALRELKGAEADLLVGDQSRPGEVDLHGVNVRDAVTIAKQRVDSWWEREGREWAREGKVRDGGLRMITGKGQHSEGGKGKLGPAIGAMLVKAGWKVEVGQGFIDVVGKFRR